jgi:hypothetical protein
MTDAVNRAIVDFVSSLPALTSSRPEQQRDGVLFLADDAPEWRGEPLRLDQSGGESARLQRAQRRCWIRMDGDVEIRLPGDSANGAHQLIRALATAWALATNFAPMFGASIAYAGRLAFRLEGLEDRGFIVSDSYDDWLDGELSSDFADAFLAPVLDAQSAGGRAGEPEETRKLLRSHWRNEIVRTGEAEPTTPDEEVGTTVIAVREAGGGTAISGATVAAVSANGTVVSAVTDDVGTAALTLVPNKSYTALIAHNRHPGRVMALDASARKVDVAMNTSQAGVGSVIGLNGVAYIPGLDGRLNAIHDQLDRRYLYAENVSIDNKSTQPVAFEIGLPFTLEDAAGARFRATVPFSLGTTFLLDYSEKPRG